MSSQPRWRSGSARRPATSAILYDMWQAARLRPADRDRPRRRGQRYRAGPRAAPWRQIDLANGSFGQGVAVTPIQLATSYAAMMNGGQLVQPHVVKAVGDGNRVAPGRPGHRCGDVANLIGLMNHVVTTVPFYRDRTLVPGYYVGGKTGTAQIWDPKANNGRGAGSDLFNYSFVGYIGRETGRPDLVVAIRIEEGTPNVVKVGQLEMPVMSFELFRRIATDAITTPDLLADRPAPCPDRGPVTRPYATLAPVTDVDPSTPAAGPPGARPDRGRPRPPDRRPAPRPVRPTHPRRGRRFPRWSPGKLFVALPGERTDGHAHLADAVAAGAAAADRHPARCRTGGLGDVTVDPRRRSAGRARGGRGRLARRFDPLVVGVTGSIAKTSTKEAVAAVLGRRFRTLRNEGNQNNEIGLPLTVLRLGPEHEAAVLEMGMYVGGEIADLARIARPRSGS